MTRLTATEVARSFSDTLNRVTAGEAIEIVRNGAVVAEMRPPSPPRAISAAAWREMVASAPEVDGDFARDVSLARDEVGPPVDAWPS